MTVKDKVVVVGGGPVGALAALYTARRGYEVEVYEFRDGQHIVSKPHFLKFMLTWHRSERTFSL